MFITIKYDIVNMTCNIVSVKTKFDTSLSNLNKYININYIDAVVYVDNENEFSIYQRGLIFGKSLLYKFYIIKYDSTNQKQIHNVQESEFSDTVQTLILENQDL